MVGFSKLESDMGFVIKRRVLIPYYPYIPTI